MSSTSSTLVPAHSVPRKRRQVDLDRPGDVDLARLGEQAHDERGRRLGGRHPDVVVGRPHPRVVLEHDAPPVDHDHALRPRPRRGEVVGERRPAGRDPGLPDPRVEGGGERHDVALPHDRRGGQPDAEVQEVEQRDVARRDHLLVAVASPQLPGLRGGEAGAGGRDGDLRRDLGRLLREQGQGQENERQHRDGTQLHVKPPVQDGAAIGSCHEASLRVSALTAGDAGLSQGRLLDPLDRWRRPLSLDQFLSGP